MESSAILREWFDRVDSEKIGSITAIQLKSAFAIGNLEFTISVVQQMIRMYDFDKNGTMSFEEFVGLNKFLLKNLAIVAQPHLGSTKMKSLVLHEFNGATCVLRLGEVNFFFGKAFPFVACFLLLIWGRGFLVPDDVYEALIKIGFHLDSPALYTVCESFDRNKNGKFRLDDFISLCVFVQSARNLFDSFDTSKQGRVTLDINQFIYCTANCRI